MDTELCELLADLGRAGFLIQSYQEDRNGPEVVVGVLQRADDCADVLMLRDEQTACAWRTPIGEGRDELAPAEVHWQIAGKAARVLKELLALPAPGKRAAPTVLMPAMPGLGLPVERRGHPVRMRFRGI